MTDTPISSWQDAFTALRRPGRRSYATLVLVTGCMLYLAGAEASFAITLAAYHLVVHPALVAAFGYEPVPTGTQLVMGMASGALLVYTWVRVLPRVLWGWSRSVWRRPVTPEQRSADAQDLLDLFAMAGTPRMLADVVIVMSPCPRIPSRLHPRRRWRVMVAWGRRNAEIEAVAAGLAKAGLLRRTERARRWDGMSVYEITDAGRESVMDFAATITEG